MTIDSDRLCYVVRIEGIGYPGSSLRAAYCYPQRPDYGVALAYYNAGLVEPPIGVSAAIDLIACGSTIGRFRLVLDPTIGPVNWRITKPRPVNEIRELISVGENNWNTARSNTASGIVVGTIVYIERETVRVTTATPATAGFVCTRGICSTQDVEHLEGADLYLQPPTLIGREVWVYAATRDGGVITDEVLIGHGYINSEPAWSGHACAIEVTDRFTEPICPDPIPDAIIGHGGNAMSTIRSSEHYPIGNPSGGYWLHQPGGGVKEASWASGLWRFDSGWLLQPPEDVQNEGTVDRISAYQILLSDVSFTYPAFGRFSPATPVVEGTWVADDHPCVITLALLLSREGMALANWATGDRYVYDHGGTVDRTNGAGWLAPAFSLGLDRALVDVPAFERLMLGELAGLRAPRVWLGGDRQINLLELIQSMWRPIGCVVAPGRTGVWSISRLADVYPEDIVTTVVPVRGTVSQSAQSRAVDTLTIPIDPGPSGESVDAIVVSEDDERSYYPRHVGQHLTIEQAAPYTIEQWTEDSPLTQLAQQHLLRLALRLSWIEWQDGPDHFNAAQLYAAMRIVDPSAYDPETGLATASGLPARITSVKPDLRTRQVTCSGLVCDMGKLALIGPSAQIDTWATPPPTATTVSRVYTSEGDDDALRFAVGDTVVLLDSRLVLLSDDGRTHPRTVVARTATTIEISAAWVDGAGAALVGHPTTGDVIVHAHWDAVSQERLAHAWDADGGDRTTADPSLGAGAVAPYTLGV
jgi:hypothetical protein